MNSRRNGNRATLTIGQLATRWSVSPERIRGLIDAGLLDAFQIPSAGRYGATVKIPMAAVQSAEQSWEITPRSTRREPPREQGGSKSGLNHLADFVAGQSSDESLEGGSC